MPSVQPVIPNAVCGMIGEPASPRQLGELAVEGGLTRGQQRVFARIPAEEVRRACVRGVMFAGFPDFVKEKEIGVIGAAVQVVLQAAFLFAGGGDKGAEFGFEQHGLAFLGAQNHDVGHRVLG